ncbi:MAG: outer membrane lipoprotein LolB [Rhodocyclaceae bacterium]|nr:outer membrane lipoprotein LolB [Rhodocyclaceae bacterium]
MSRFASLLAALLLLCGCAATPPVPPRPAPEAIVAFSLFGRLAIRQGQTQHHLSVDWRHAPERDEILLTTPFGQAVGEIVRDGSGARLVLADRREFAAADAETLAEQVLGFRLPFGTLLRGLLGGLTPAAEWTVRVLAREGDAPTALPTLIEFAREDVTVRLKIDEWTEVR